MSQYFILLCCLCLCVSCLDLDTYSSEGGECTIDYRAWIEGTCVEEKRCLSALDKNPTLPKCLDEEAGKSLVCCADCNLLDDTSDIVLSPNGEIFEKNGDKAADSCLGYIQELPYKCRDDYKSVFKRVWNETGRCYNTVPVTEKLPESNRTSERAQYPHQALLGYGDTLDTVEWLAGGSIISDRFILTAAHTSNSDIHRNLSFIAVGVQNTSDPTSYNGLPWQILKVKRMVRHPSYANYRQDHDIALIETVEKIVFNENVLPACLDVEGVNVTEAVATTWWDLSQEGWVFADTIQTIKNVEPVSEALCLKIPSKHHTRLTFKFDTSYQMCFASNKNPSDSCRGFSGEPLLIHSEFASCPHTIVGVISFGASVCGHTEELIPDVYSRVSYFVPWIESIVWP